MVTSGGVIRTSRKMQDILVPHPKAWLEIRGSSDTQDRNNIEVGEYMTILVNTWLPGKNITVQLNSGVLGDLSNTLWGWP